MSTRVLAIDTTAEFGSIALTEDGKLIEEVLLHSPEGFGQILFLQIERLLERHDWRIAYLEGLAGLAGPGSFTGVRIGLAAVKGLAEAAGKRCVAVSNLQALSWFGDAPLRATVLDARRGEVYAAVYDGSFNPITAEVVMTFPDWLTTLPPREEMEFISTNFAPFQHALAGTRFARARVITAPRALAGAAAAIATRALNEDAALDPAAIDANYVRRSDAELLWKDR